MRHHRISPGVWCSNIHSHIHHNWIGMCIMLPFRSAMWCGVNDPNAVPYTMQYNVFLDNPDAH